MAVHLPLKTSPSMWWFLVLSPQSPCSLQAGTCFSNHSLHTLISGSFKHRSLKLLSSCPWKGLFLGIWDFDFALQTQVIFHVSKRPGNHMLGCRRVSSRVTEVGIHWDPHTGGANDLTFCTGPSVPVPWQVFVKMKGNAGEHLIQYQAQGHCQTVVDLVGEITTEQVHSSRTSELEEKMSSLLWPLQPQLHQFKTDRMIHDF